MKFFCFLINLHTKDFINEKIKDFNNKFLNNILIFKKSNINLIYKTYI